MQAHELARVLLSGPDVKVMGFSPFGTPLWISKICQTEHGSCEDNEDLDGSEGEEPVTKQAIVLVLNEDDGFFTGVPV
jgi:hypothetical protein